MSSVVKSAAKVFGGGSSPSINVNQPFRFGRSRLQGGRLKIDPRFEQNRNRYLEGIEELQPLATRFSGFAPRFADLSEEFAGNEGRLINARLNPLRRRIASAEGDLKESLNRRKVFGSFANQDLTGFDIDAGIALGDAEALATMDALSARTDLTGREMAAAEADVQNQLRFNQLYGNAASTILQEELAGLQLSSGVMSKLMAMQADVEASNRDFNSKVAGTLLGAAGGLFSDGGVTAGSVTSNPSVFNNVYTTQPYNPSFGFRGNYRGLTF